MVCALQRRQSPSSASPMTPVQRSMHSSQMRPACTPMSLPTWLSSCQQSEQALLVIGASAIGLTTRRLRGRRMGR